MTEHASEWLNAYLDGELGGLRLRQVEQHLERCAACRAELEALRGLSALLRETPPAAEFTPTGRFVSNLTSSLPRRPDASQPRKAASPGWWLVPAGLLGAWFFLRTALTLTGVFTAADATGLLGQATSWLDSGQQQAVWFTALTGLFGGQMTGTQQSTLSLLNRVNIFGANLWNGFLWQAAIVLLYWVWLAGWWLSRRPFLESFSSGFSHS